MIIVNILQLKMQQVPTSQKNKADFKDGMWSK